MGAGAQRIHGPDDLMPRDNWPFAPLEIALDHVQVRPADRAAVHPKTYLIFSWLRYREVYKS